MATYIFKRYEKKYLIDSEKFKAVTQSIAPYVLPDRHGESEICNIYFDTPDYRIIRESIEKPVYKEKLRLRCYGVPTDTSRCFLELKKKFNGVVYKRRISESYALGCDFLCGVRDNIPPSQIKEEIEYFRYAYSYPKPRMNIFYLRTAYYDSQNPEVRLTFDRNVLYRCDNLDLKYGISGKVILPKDYVIMEIKTAGAMPLWLTKILTELEIYPASFSKYGTAYIDMLNNGGINNA